MNFASKICKFCGKEFLPTGRNQLYCEECRPILRKEYVRRWIKKHPEKAKENKRRWDKNNPEKKKEEKRQSRLRHLDKVKVRMKQWKKNNPDKLKALRVKYKCKRRQFGFVPLNEYFEGSVFHHVDLNYGLYIPEEIHKSIHHSVLKDINMDEINALAFNYLRNS